MDISEFDYDLPEELIAQSPLLERDSSRMLVVRPRERNWLDAQFADFADYLRAGDVVVVNNTRVFPARFVGTRKGTGGRIEILLVREIETLTWEALVRNSSRLQQGTIVRFGESNAVVELIDAPGAEMRLVRFNSEADFEHLLTVNGQVPLPPYIKRLGGTTSADEERYQTVYAKERGAIAAPTAGLHFTSRIFDQLRRLGVEIVEVTLHVGYGTFEPVRSPLVSAHRVRAEAFEISAMAANVINASRSAGGRVVAIGTTTTRALESAIKSDGTLQPVSSLADLTITPGYDFQVTDALLTNFHLPRSSLILLVAAFAGRELILNAYAHAIRQRYRFYSYGDCMLII
ncbi:MAG TPA: tRNA preQ1(34) S-adenosylmethionine ribosyltransferase-isomerase QueA [Pyrinomonadaceae bacterium]|nr:tRNA preQ1(34) S-adenosylmethionine ribosyltransferase-isomerase QueA [Pyrinomonadaceae bacterium]